MSNNMEAKSIVNFAVKCMGTLFEMIIFLVYVTVLALLTMFGFLGIISPFPFWTQTLTFVALFFFCAYLLKEAIVYFWNKVQGKPDDPCMDCRFSNALTNFMIIMAIILFWHFPVSGTAMLIRHDIQILIASSMTIAYAALVIYHCWNKYKSRTK